MITMAQQEAVIFAILVLFLVLILWVFLHRKQLDAQLKRYFKKKGEESVTIKGGSSLEDRLLTLQTIHGTAFKAELHVSDSQVVIFASQQLDEKEKLLINQETTVDKNWVG